MNTWKECRKNFANAKKMIWDAKEKKYAIGQFNINNLEWTRAILETAQECKSPVILGVSEGAARYFGGYKTVTGLVAGMIQDLKITVPVAVHLDHGSTIEVCEIALEAGFSSIMVDGSKYPIEENIILTKRVSELCKKYDASVEGEVGVVAGEEDGVQGGTAATYADTDECLRLAKEGGLDFLAATLGSVHGHYHGMPHLNFERMSFISQNSHIPLVLHGGSGIPDADIQHAISCGEAKINVNTECQDAFAAATRKYFEQNLDHIGKGYDPRQILKPGFNAIKAVVKNKMTLFGSINKA